MADPISPIYFLLTGIIGGGALVTYFTYFPGEATEPYEPINELGRISGRMRREIKGRRFYFIALSDIIYNFILL